MILMLCHGVNRFHRWMAIATAGATNDQLAFECSRLGQQISAGCLPEPYCLFPDAAYMASTSCVTPFSDVNPCKFS
jgi:hypothetical protein